MDEGRVKLHRATPRGPAASPVGSAPSPGLRRRAALLALPALCLATRAAHAAEDLPALGRAAADELDLHGLLVWQGDRLLLEHYRRSRDRPINDFFAREVQFGPQVLHDMRSVSKSFVALLVGQAVARGEIDLQQPVLEALPGLSDLATQGREAIRIEHLLTMSSGLSWNETATTYGTTANDETRLSWDHDPARYILDRPLAAPPGTRWNYNGGHTVLLAQLLQQRTGLALVELARRDLFGPLGITQFEWRRGQHLQPLSYAGLRLAPPDLMTLGRTMLAGGLWEGRRVLDATWVAGTLQPRITIEGPLRYGWHWWCGEARSGDRVVPWTAAIGNGGQRLFVLPALDLAVVTTAGAYNDPSIAPRLGRLVSRIVGAL